MSGLYKENDKQVIEPFSDRVNLALLYLSAQMVHSESKEATAALFSPKFEGINEIGCTWTSRKGERSYTECCSDDTQCSSLNCYQWKYCGQNCTKPHIGGQIYNLNGECCHTSRECISGYCNKGICERDCFIDSNIAGKLNGACCEEDNMCLSDHCMAGECVGDLVTNYMKFERKRFNTNIIVVALIAFFLLICVVTGYCGFINGRMRAINEQL